MVFVLGSRPLVRSQLAPRPAHAAKAALPRPVSTVGDRGLLPITPAQPMGLPDACLRLLQTRLQQNVQRCRAMPSSQPIVRELPTKVAETFYVVQDPALFNTSYSDALLVCAADCAAFQQEGRECACMPPDAQQQLDGSAG